MFGVCYGRWLQSTEASMFTATIISLIIVIEAVIIIGMGGIMIIVMEVV